MSQHKADEQIAEEYCNLMEIDLSRCPRWYFGHLVAIIKLARKEEPRINSGVHLYDWTMICDEDDDFDSFYGPDYFKEMDDESVANTERGDGTSQGPQG